jgi:hypothetical protein
VAAGCTGAAVLSLPVVVLVESYEWEAASPVPLVAMVGIPAVPRGCVAAVDPQILESSSCKMAVANVAHRSIHSVVESVDAALVSAASAADL